MNIYSIIISLSIVLLIFLVKRKVTKFENDTFWKIFFYTTLFSILGAKIFHLLENLNFYINNLNFISLSKGYSILGAITFGYFTLNFFDKNFSILIYEMKSYLFLYLPVIQSIGRTGNIFNNELLPFSYYEIFLNLINFLILLKVKTINPKFVVYSFFLNYGIIRILIESLKGNYGFLFYVSLIFTFYGFFMIFKLRYKV